MLDTQPTFEHVVGLRLVLARGLLRDQHDLPAGLHGRLERLDRLGRPTNSGITMWGNTTTSRSGSSGSVICSAGRIGCPDIEVPLFLGPI
jgi:hypothetical protein